MGDDVVRISIGTASESARESDGSSGSSGDQKLYERAVSLMGGQSYVTGSSVDADGLVVNVRDGDASAPRLLKLMIENDIEVARLAVSKPTLDDVFLKYTGRTIRPDHGGGDEYAQSIRPLLGLRRRG